MANANKRGALIRRVREAAGLTRQQLASRVDCAESTLQRIERSESECGSAAVLGRIALALGLDVGYVVTGKRPARRT